MKNAICLKKVKLEPDDILLLEINPELISIEEAKFIYDGFGKTFPDNEVIAYLSGTTVHIVKEKDYDIIPVEIE